jgi:predicted secreted protein
MSNAFRRLVLVVALAASTMAWAQTPEKTPIIDGLNLESTVSSQVAPDTAVIVMAVDKEGQDTAAMTTETNQVLAKALADAKATAGVQAASGGYSTSQIYNNKGQRTGWHVRAELILKSKDFGTLGKLAGRLSSTMQIAQNSFELSPEIRATEEDKLIERGIAALQQKAKAAVKALGYKDFAVREITLGSARLNNEPPPMQQMRMSVASAGAEAMSIESGRVNLQLTVQGLLTMKR